LRSFPPKNFDAANDVVIRPYWEARRGRVVALRRLGIAARYLYPSRQS